MTNQFFDPALSLDTDAPPGFLHGYAGDGMNSTCHLNYTAPADVLTAAVKVICLDDPKFALSKWKQIGAAVKTANAIDGFAIWDAWSKQHLPSYDPDTQRSTWQGFIAGKTPIGAIFMAANDEDPDWWRVGGAVETWVKTSRRDYARSHAPPPPTSVPTPPHGASDQPLGSHANPT
jgi:hypothetical protein